MRILYHDAELARLVFSELARINRSMTYETWIKHYVSPVVRGLGLPVAGFRVWPGSRLHVVSVKMPRALVERLDRAAERLGVTRSELVRFLVESFLEALETEGGGEP